MSTLELSIENDDINHIISTCNMDHMAHMIWHIVGSRDWTESIKQVTLFRVAQLWDDGTCYS